MATHYGKKWGCFYKILISQQQLILERKLGIKLIHRHSTFFAGRICKVTDLNMHEFVMKTEGIKKVRKNQGVFLQNYSYLC